MVIKMIAFVIYRHCTGGSYCLISNGLKMSSGRTWAFYLTGELMYYMLRETTKLC